MAGAKVGSDHIDHAPPPNPNAPPPPDHPDYEALLTGVIVLASLFSNCVEAFNLIHPSQRWDKQEQLLITALGVQQARLLIWGDTVGISSPPPTVTDRAIPKHPSAAYPDLNEPTFFSARDPALDEPSTRQKVDEALSAIVDRSAHTSREEMMELYGLRPPKRFTVEYQPALDSNRLESFRERHELLKEVAESYAHLNTRRNSSIVASTWAVSDYTKFADFIKLTQEKVDYLIELTDSQERVDRAMCMDIRALGWHLSADRARVAHDRSKLMLILEYSRQEYPQYVEAVNIALRNIERERKENAAEYNPYTAAQYAPISTPHPAPVPRSARGSISTGSGAAENGSGAAKEHKKHSIFGGLFKRKGHLHPAAAADPKARSLSVADAGDPERSLSDVGPMSPTVQTSGAGLEAPAAPDSLDVVSSPVRSKSVGDILDAPINTSDEEEMRLQLEQMRTNNTVSTVADDEGPSPTRAHPDHRLIPEISRHDQYHGLGRQGTKTQW